MDLKQKTDHRCAKSVKAVALASKAPQDLAERGERPAKCFEWMGFLWYLRQEDVKNIHK